MRTLFVSLAVVLFAFSVLSFAQSAPFTAAAKPQAPTRVNDFSLHQRPRFLSFSNLPTDVLTTLHSGNAALAAATIASIPHWSNSFTYNNTKYSYTMVGGKPSSGGTTHVGTSLLPISFLFDGYADASGHKLKIGPSSVLTKVTASPNWSSSHTYATGKTQFADAVQRAEFYNTMTSGWHTLVNTPRMLSAVTIEVPTGKAKVYKTASGTTFALVDADFFLSRLDAILSKADIRIPELPIAVSRNILLYTEGNTSHCCVLGFHTVFDLGTVGTQHYLQTFAWAAWLDRGIFSNTDIADVLPLSHEISEWMDDPFVNNKTPRWEFPDNSGCQANLETGDPVQVLSNPALTVTLNSFNYHPQTEALLQWFSRQKPSSAYHGAYSFPDMNALKSPSKPCTAP